MNLSSKNSESFWQFVKHVCKTFCAIRENNCKFGHRIILGEYLKICFKYFFFEIVWRRKIFNEMILGKFVKILDYRLFITLFETIFIYDEYYFISDKPDPLVIDCGANIGMSTLYLKLLYPQAKIVALEPDPTTYKVLNENILTNKMTEIEVLNKAVFGRRGKISFYVDQDRLGSLVMSTNPFRVANNRRVVVPAVTLTEILTKYKVVDFIKMDVEGAELRVLREMAKSGAIDRVVQLIVEYHHHILPGENRVSELFGLLERANMEYMISTHKPFSPFLRDTYQDILVFAYKNPELTK